MFTVKDVVKANGGITASCKIVLLFGIIPIYRRVHAYKYVYEPFEGGTP